MKGLLGFVNKRTARCCAAGHPLDKVPSLMTIAPRRSPRSHTEAELAASEAAHAHDPERADMIARVRRFKASWFELGSALTEMRRTERFKEWGFANFEDYCRRELHLKRETADKLTGSYAF